MPKQIEKSYINALTSILTTKRFLINNGKFDLAKQIQDFEKELIANNS